MTRRSSDTSAADDNGRNQNAEAVHGGDSTAIAGFGSTTETRTKRIGWFLVYGLRLTGFQLGEVAGERTFHEGELPTEPR